MEKKNRQPRWDVYEAVILIDAYTKIKAKNITRKDAVKKVSELLRERAKKNGISVDETFRNENGINMRFGELDSIFCGGDKGLKNTSSLFKDTVRLYQENNDEYCRLLKEATGMEDTSLKVCESFEKWLRQNASNLDIDRIMKRYADIEDFCLKTKVLDRSLFDTTDVATIKRVRKMVSQSKIFKIKYKRFYDESVKAAEWYYAYVLDLSKKKEVDIGDEHEPNESLKAEEFLLDESEFRSWLLDFGMAEPTCMSYISALHTAERYAKDNRINGIKFTDASFALVLESINRLMANNGFIRMNQEQHNRFSGSFAKLKSFIDYKTGGGLITSVKPVSFELKDVKSDQELSELNDEVNDLLLKSKDGISKEELLSRFDKYSTRSVNLSLEACHAVLVLKKYFHKDNIFDYENMADILFEIINKQFDQNGNYTSALQLYNEAKIRLDDFFFYNSAFGSKAEIFDLAVHLFSQEKYKGNSYIFLNNMHIWKEEPDYPKDFHGLMIKYAREHGNTFTRDEAVEYLEWIGSATPAQSFSYMIFNTGSNTFFQYDENSFVLAEALGINDHFLNYLKTQLGNLLEGEDYVSFGEIDEYFYTTLPKLPACVYWSALLLEDILRVYNLDYFTVEAGKDNDKKTIPAALIKKNSAYKSFADVVWAEMSKEFSLPKELSASEFRDFLLEKGFIRGSEKMWNVHKTVVGDIRFFWTNNNSKVTIN